MSRFSRMVLHPRIALLITVSAIFRPGDPGLSAITFSCFAMPRMRIELPSLVSLNLIIIALTDANKYEK